MKCLLCCYSDESAAKIEEHINKEHFDLYSPSVSGNDRSVTSSSFVCPLCFLSFDDATALESHVNGVHKDILSPVKVKDKCSDEMYSAPLLECPVCVKFTSTSESELTEHVEQHYEGPSVSADLSNDFFIAKQLVTAEEEQSKRDEQKEFELFQAQYGMNNDGNFKEQTAQYLEKAVISGELSVGDFYEKQAKLRIAETYGVDDGSSHIEDILPCIREKSQKCFNVAHTYLCSNLDFYAASYGDRGWGCGFRNLQILLSALFREKCYADLLLKSKLMVTDSPSALRMPSISKLQKAIEDAWSLGFDIKGREQFGGKVRNTRKWIGATDVVALLSSLRFQCQIVDVRKSSANGLHPKMFDWIFQYFQKKELFKPPLYLQHQGHSRTVVGVEVLKDDEKLLLILDPGVSRQQMEKTLYNQNASNSLRFLRKSLQSMKQQQFQIATVVGIVSSEEEYEANKTIENFLTIL